MLFLTILGTRGRNLIVVGGVDSSWELMGCTWSGLWEAGQRFVNKQQFRIQRGPIFTNIK